MRLDRRIQAYDLWSRRIPEAYARAMLDKKGPHPDQPDGDDHCLASIRHYRSLVPLAQEARKPVFHLRAADGAIGGHAAAVREAHREYRNLAEKIRTRIGSGGTAGTEA